MNPFAYLAFYGWVPFLLFLFTMLNPQRIVIVGYIGAYLFLPVVGLYLLPGFPIFEKTTLTSYAILIGVLIFDSDRLNQFKPGWLDLPMLLWMLCPFFSNYTNDLGLPEALKGSMHQVIIWGLPYFFGRLYLSSLESLRKLAIAIFTGGLLYIPFCLWEIRFSSGIHSPVYGFPALRDYAQSIRYGGYRPNVFTPHGLSVSIWMTSATLIGIWFWQTGAVKKIGNFAINQVAVAILVTVLMLRSTGAWFLLATGLLTLSIARWFKTAFLVGVLTLSTSSYLYVASTGAFTGDQIIAFVTQITDADRAASLQFRFDNEEILSAKARQKILFGWGWNGRNRVLDPYGKDITVTDSLWIIVFGVNGVAGLISLWGAILLPANLFVFRFPPRLWTHPKVAPTAALVVVLTIYMTDCLSNAFPNDVYTLAAGGITGLVSGQPQKD
jgi:hypothetical protein